MEHINLGSVIEQAISNSAETTSATNPNVCDDFAKSNSYSLA